MVVYANASFTVSFKLHFIKMCVELWVCVVKGGGAGDIAGEAGESAAV